MNNKKFLKVLAEERQSLHQFREKVKRQIQPTEPQLQSSILDVVAGRIMFYLFKDGKFKLFYTLSNLHRIAANVVLYLELQRQDGGVGLVRFIEGYQPVKPIHK